MRHTCLRSVALVSLAMLGACALSPQRDAMQAAQEYGNAVSRVDVDKMISMWDPEVIKRGDPAEDKRMILRILDPSTITAEAGPPCQSH